MSGTRLRARGGCGRSAVKLLHFSLEFGRDVDALRSTEPPQDTREFITTAPARVLSL